MEMSHVKMAVANTEDQVEIKNMGFEPKVIYQSCVFFSFKYCN